MKTKFRRSLLTLTSVVIITQPALSQTYQPTNRAPVADNTLGTQVSGNGNNFNITGGVTKGQTLFQSFTDFSVPTNGSANFVNPVGNRDIITRVTGNLFSDINGTVNTNGANFFLINPNGIVFGTNARLNVGKAFVGSTANSIDLVGAGGRTMTFGTNPNGDAPLLSVAPNVLFDVSRLNFSGGTGAISNFATLQTPNNSQYIGLIGGNVILDGSNGGGKIVAPGGRVDLGGLSGAGNVTIDNNGLVFSSVSVGRSNVVLTDGAGITVRATSMSPVNPFFNNGTSSSGINISADRIDFRSNTQPTSLDAGWNANLGVQTIATGDIKLDATGKVNLDNAAIRNTLRAGTQGRIGDVKIRAGAVDINNSTISSATNGLGNAGNIDITVNGGINITNNSIILSDNINARGQAGDINIKAVGDIKISGSDSSSINPTLSQINSNTSGLGDAGKITIDTQGKLSVINGGFIDSSIAPTGVGNSQGIRITARELVLANGSNIFSLTEQTERVDGKGNAGDINIKTTGDIKIAGDASAIDPASSQIASNSNGQGDTGKITIDTQGKLSLSDRGVISSTIAPKGVGNSNGIRITAQESFLAHNSFIFTNTFSTTQGNAGDINIKTTGDIQISGSDSSINPILSQISTATDGQGDAGKITIDTQGKLSLNNRGSITSAIGNNGVGNSNGINITTRELSLANNSFISTDTSQTDRVDGKGNAGDINIKTTGDIQISGSDSLSVNPSSSQITSSTDGQGSGGKITIDTQGKLSLNNSGTITSTIESNGVGNGKGINITARELELTNNSNILSATAQTAEVAGTGKAGDVNLNVQDLILANNSSIFTNSFGTGQAGNINLNVGGTIQANNSSISTISSGAGQAGNISITSDRLILNRGVVTSFGSTVTGGNITISISDKLLMQNNSFITSLSGSSEKNGNGGNITISSPLIIALPGNNDINADAFQGTGGNVRIASQGLFGIQFRATGSPFTNDITASSTFGQNGTVNITTPGTDPGRDSTELPNTTTDASKQISQACSANNRQNKLTVAGRGGLPPNANDPLTSDVVWQDARAASSPPAVSSATNNSATLAPPAVGWVFDGKGKVTLVAAVTQGQPKGTRVVCPQRVGK
jgi:filamentous hemagglutinin family protein